MLSRLVRGYIRPIKDEKGHVKRDSIATLEKVILGELEQWITIRGHNRHHPILLFLHGGPGASQVGTQQKYLAQLEQSFVVVNWDQRGAGKSYHSLIPSKSMNVNQLISDTYELVLYLQQRFKQEKVFLTGHSWGAFLGIRFAYQYPELLHAYVGINQPVKRREEEKRSYQYALDTAQKKANKKALNELRAIEFIEEGVYKNMHHLTKQRSWLTKLGGVTFEKKCFKH